MRKIIIFLILFCFSSGVFAGTNQLYKLNGDSLSYEELISAPKTVLFIWAAWCPSCKAEFKRLSQECSNFEGVKIIYVNAGEPKSKIEDFIKSNGTKDCAKEKVVLDPELILSRKFSIFAIPAFIIIKDGKVVHKSYFINQELIDTVFKSEKF